MDEGSQVLEVVRKSIDLTSCQMGLPAGHTVEAAPIERHCFSSPKGGVSPEASSTASDSPTPTNSAATHWHGLVCEEQRQLLGTEEESSDRHSSEDDGGENEDDVEGGDVWKITQEQREYYSAQFRSLQPDPMGLVAGPVARLFFEKSRLPVLELRKIWMLADVSKDGALSLGEFHTAMHLVVLRRNKIELPDSLPPSLVPLPSLSLANTIVPPVTAQHANATASAPTQPPLAKPAPQPAHREDSPPSLSPPAGDTSSTPQSKEWTKFVDSPTSSVSSPGPKPVNFDFHKAAVEQDPKILHPVPLRITPDSQGLPSGNDEEVVLSTAVPPRSPRKTVEPVSQEHPPGFTNMSGSSGNSSTSSVSVAPNDRTSPKKGSSMAASLDSGDIRPIQRPQPKKHAVPGPGAIPPPPITSALLSNTADFSNMGTSNSGPGSLPVSISSGVSVMKSQGLKKEPPPPPPPRPIRAHTRSSSLDLNHLGNAENLIAPPVIPPRISPCMPGFADFAHFGMGDEREAEDEDDESGGSEEDEYDDEGIAKESEEREVPLEAASHDTLPESQETSKSHSPTHMHTTHGAFQVYRKPMKVSRSGKNQETNVGWSEVQRQRHRSDPSELVTSRLPELHNQPGKMAGCPNEPLINAYRESNDALSKLCAELSHELSLARHVRLTLEMKMEGNQDQFLS